MIDRAVDGAYAAVALAQGILAAPPRPTDQPMLQEGQREDIDRFLVVARGALAQAYAAIHGHMPPKELAAYQRDVGANFNEPPRLQRGP